MNIYHRSLFIYGKYEMVAKFINFFFGFIFYFLFSIFRAVIIIINILNNIHHHSCHTLKYIYERMKKEEGVLSVSSQYLYNVPINNLLEWIQFKKKEKRKAIRLFTYILWLPWIFILGHFQD
jgi:hypothetical protein